MGPADTICFPSCARSFPSPAAKDPSHRQVPLVCARCSTHLRHRCLAGLSIPQAIPQDGRPPCLPWLLTCHVSVGKGHLHKWALVVLGALNGVFAQGSVCRLRCSPVTNKPAFFLPPSFLSSSSSSSNAKFYHSKQARCKQTRDSLSF